MRVSALMTQSSRRTVGSHTQCWLSQVMVPLIYAPMLPLIRITLRNQPVLRDRVFAVAVLGMCFLYDARVCFFTYH